MLTGAVQGKGKGTNTSVFAPLLQEVNKLEEIWANHSKEDNRAVHPEVIQHVRKLEQLLELKRVGNTKLARRTDELDDRVKLFLYSKQ